VTDEGMRSALPYRQLLVMQRVRVFCWCHLWALT